MLDWACDFEPDHPGLESLLVLAVLLHLGEDDDNYNDNGGGSGET